MLFAFARIEHEIKLALRTFPLIRIVLILKRVRNIYPRAVVHEKKKKKIENSVTKFFPSESTNSFVHKVTFDDTKKKERKKGRKNWRREEK